jgi:hypothetical protein
MKKTILFFVFALIALNFCLAQEWFTSLKVAKRLALVQNKMLFVLWEDSFNYPYPILIDDSGNSIMIDLFEDDRINSIIWDYFVPVKLSELKYPELSHKIKETRGEKYFNKLIDDSIKIMDVNGNILNTKISYEPVENLSLLIEHYALNTFFLKQEFLNYIKEKNATTAFSLASKYLDFAVLSNKAVRNEIIQLANIYFDESKSYLPKSDLNNKDAFLQRCDLLEIKEALILNKPRKVLRRLKKVNIAEIYNRNQSLFYFLNYTAYKLLKNEDNAALWKSKISLVDLKKAKLIININF